MNIRSFYGLTPLRLSIIVNEQSFIKSERGDDEEHDDDGPG